MLAQAFPEAQITALEINEGALLDAQYNIKQSPFAHRIELLKQDFLSYKPSEAFDLIVSNPPYFSATGAIAPDGGRALARQEQSEGLNLVRLMNLSQAMLSRQDGSSLCLITPLDREMDLRLYACEAGLRSQSLCRVSSLPNKGVRLLSSWTHLELSSAYCRSDISELTLHKSDQTPSQAYADLLSPFLP
ncbi:tRNA1(Val) (adenine(37)-N6)-methyltransferase-like [Globicephala melas]|uniref:tRNA1(Val) (adenine(37)-N6)-methyltransferase-like n=1 Tax=Globicephala melas TaxID=9731 RepID=UPI00293D1F0A|nr:tRNA1(Val) (adenine(37)-N6)-methyltransferase-like [Globicephala melas]